MFLDYGGDKRFVVKGYVNASFEIVQNGPVKEEILVCITRCKVE